MVGKPFIDKTLSLTDGQIEQDRRGWKKGKTRNHQQDEIERIISIRLTLTHCDTYYCGLTAFKKIRYRNISQYHHYPEITILNLGKIIEEIDFVEKAMGNMSCPINFFARMYLRPFRVGRYSRIPAQRSIYARKELESDWKTGLPMPNICKLDNGLAFTGTGTRKREIAGFPSWLMNTGITPVFIAPAKPWQNGRLEGLNSVFGKKVWEARNFLSLKEIDRAIERFHQATDGYREIKPIKFKKRVSGSRGTSQRIYFIRQVDERGINILKEQIPVPRNYISQYVLVEINVRDQRLNVYFEKDSKTLISVIKPMTFQVRMNRMKYI